MEDPSAGSVGSRVGQVTRPPQREKGRGVEETPVEFHQALGFRRCKAGPPATDAATRTRSRNSAGVTGMQPVTPAARLVHAPEHAFYPTACCIVLIADIRGRACRASHRGGGGGAASTELTNGGSLPSADTVLASRIRPPATGFGADRRGHGMTHAQRPRDVWSMLKVNVW